MRFAAGILLSLGSIGLTMHAQRHSSPSDFERYVEEVRKRGMTESADSDIAGIASVTSGAVLLIFEEVGQTGKFNQHFVSTVCPIPGAEEEEVKRWKAELRHKADSLAILYRVLADFDSSGFVSTEEGSHFELLYRFASARDQLAPRHGSSPKLIAAALYIAETKIEGLARDYSILYQRVVETGIHGWPPAE